MVCERCYQPLETGEHGLYKCPLERRMPAPTIRPDSIPGGRWIEHGIGNADGTARRYDSHSEIRLEAQKRGLTPWGECWDSSRTRDGREYLEYRRSGAYLREKREKVEARRMKGKEY
jgi:hypothetical protein